MWVHWEPHHTKETTRNSEMADCDNFVFALNSECKKKHFRMKQVCQGHYPHICYVDAPPCIGSPVSSTNFSPLKCVQKAQINAIDHDLLPFLQRHGPQCNHIISYFNQQKGPTGYQKSASFSIRIGCFIGGGGLNMDRMGCLSANFKGAGAWGGRVKAQWRVSEVWKCISGYWHDIPHPNWTAQTAGF